jgi:hypothetical protein
VGPYSGGISVLAHQVKGIRPGDCATPRRGCVARRAAAQPARVPAGWAQSSIDERPNAFAMAGDLVVARPIGLVHDGRRRSRLCRGPCPLRLWPAPLPSPPRPWSWARRKPPSCAASDASNRATATRMSSAASCVSAPRARSRRGGRQRRPPPPAQHPCPQAAAQTRGGPGRHTLGLKRGFGEGPEALRQGTLTTAARRGHVATEEAISRTRDDEM